MPIFLMTDERVSLTGQRMPNNKRERVSRLSLTAVAANSLARLTFRPVWLSGLKKGQGGGTMEVLSAASSHRVGTQPERRSG